MISPFILASPSVGFKNPAMIFNKVDFPHPEGPRTQMNSPFSIFKLTFWRAVTSPRSPLYLKLMFSRVTTSCDSSLNNSSMAFPHFLVFLPFGYFKASSMYSGAIPFSNADFAGTFVMFF